MLRKNCTDQADPSTTQPMTPPPPPPLIRISHLSKGYVRGGQPIPVLVDIHLDVAQGEFVALMGPSGSGKSTLLNLIGLLDQPTSGRIAIQGHHTGSLDDDALTDFRGSVLGFIFQFHHLLPELTAAENVIVPRMAVTGRYRDDMLVGARELLRVKTCASTGRCCCTA